MIPNPDESTPEIISRNLEYFTRLNETINDLIHNIENLERRIRKLEEQ